MAADSDSIPCELLFNDKATCRKGASHSPILGNSDGPPLVNVCIDRCRSVFMCACCLHGYFVDDCTDMQKYTGC